MNNKGNELVLYHGSPDKQIVPTYGLGNDKHDYGKGFYLTGSLVLASELSVCNPIEKNGWVHKFTAALLLYANMHYYFVDYIKMLDNINFFVTNSSVYKYFIY